MATPEKLPNNSAHRAQTPVTELNHRNDIGQLLMLAQRDFDRRLSAALKQRKVEGISKAQGAVITHLHRFGSSRISDIARSNGIRAQSLVKVIRELESLGLLDKRDDPADSRAKLLSLTAKGRKHIQHLSRATECVWQDYANDFGAEKVSRTFASLRALFAE